jgi:penicillin-binding protein 2
MIRDQDRYQAFTRRAILLGGGKLALFSALLGRMYYLQVVEADRYRTLADDNRINLRLLAPLRGRILDRNGVEIAANQQNYRLIIVSERNPDVEGTLDRIAKIITLEDHDRRRVLRAKKRNRSFVPVTIRENLDWEEVARIEINSPDLPGVHIEVGQTRWYPYAETAAHLIGYVGAVSEAELNGDPVLELPSFRVGKNGIERLHEERLRGRAGRSEVEVNAIGRVIRELSRNEGLPGDQVSLTIDMKLQAFAHKRIGSESAAVVVMDVNNGEVLTLASAPSFDPHAFNTGITTEYWRELTANVRAPLTNKAIAGQYAPGSTFKMIVAMAALDAGIVGSDHVVRCIGHTRLGNVKFHCWKRGGHGWVDMQTALQQSCDTYFYDIARRTGVERIAVMARRFGLGAPLGIDLPGEKSGVVPTKGWKLAVVGQPWQLGETLVTGIGQGFVLTTPLQLAVMVARIANGGRAVVPRLAVRDDGEELPPAADSWPAIRVSHGALDAVRRGMFAVSNTPRGTAYRSRIKRKGWEIAGKTGTSQVRRITMAERGRGVLKNHQRPWRERDHALFVAYAPATEPRYAIAVIVEHGGGGSKAAAPIAHDVMTETLKRDPARKRLTGALREARATAAPDRTP